MECHEQHPPVKVASKIKAWFSKKLKKRSSPSAAVAETRRPVLVYFCVRHSIIGGNSWVIKIQSHALKINSLSLPLFPDFGVPGNPSLAVTKVGSLGSRPFT